MNDYICKKHLKERSITTGMKNMFEYFLLNFRLFYDTADGIAGYGDDNESKVRITKSRDLSCFDNKSNIDAGRIAWKEWKGIKIPFLFASDDKAEIISEEGGIIRINYDIVASAFFFLSGWDEYVTPDLDQFGRPEFKMSLIGKLGIVHLPVVNYYFDIVCWAVQKAGGVCKRKNLWNDSGFGVTLTHDIDTCLSAWTEGSLSEIRKKRFLSVPFLLFKRISGRDDWSNFETISKTDRRFADSSTFFFLARKGKSGKAADADYNVSSSFIRKEIDKLINAGHEVGVHGSFGTDTDGNRLSEDIARIGLEGITGTRFHFLMFNIEKTVPVLEKNSLRYDTTLCFAEHTGFRRATCYPFYLFDLKEERISSVIEIPLVVMDTTLASKKYMGIEPGNAVKNVIPVIEEVRKFGGVFTLLWHNTHFSDYKYTGWKKVYEEILDYCSEKNGYITSGRKIYERITGK